MYVAYIQGRAENDPTIGWYDGELSFFDNYIIPLANKLKRFGIFGVSCDELLDYALENRLEWSNKGQSIVLDYIAVMKDGHHCLVTPQISLASAESCGLDHHGNIDDKKENDDSNTDYHVEDDLFVVAFNHHDTY
jgi:hypothetical protein